MKLAFLYVGIVLLIYHSGNSQITHNYFEKVHTFYSDSLSKIPYVGTNKNNYLFVGDLLQSKIFMFAPDGKIKKTIGREGTGPGDFLSITGLWVYNDTLFVLDRVGLKITTFVPPNYNKVAYVINLNLQNGKFPTPAGDAAIGIGLNGLWKTSRGFFVTYGSPYSPSNLHKPHDLEMYLLNKSGNFITPTPLFRLNDKQMFVVKKNNGFMVGVMPLGVIPIIQFHDRKFYWLNNKDTKIRVTDENGNLVQTINLPVVKIIKIKNSMLREIFNLYGYSRKHSLLDLKRNGVKLPEHLPFVVNFLVDDKSRIWYATYSENFVHYNWYVIDNNGKIINQFRLPSSIIFIYSKSNWVYALNKDEMGNEKILMLKFKF